MREMLKAMVVGVKFASKQEYHIHKVPAQASWADNSSNNNTH
jgi:hypothetical protein